MSGVPFIGPERARQRESARWATDWLRESERLSARCSPDWSLHTLKENHLVCQVEDERDMEREAGSVRCTPDWLRASEGALGVVSDIGRRARGDAT